MYIHKKSNKQVGRDFILPKYKFVVVKDRIKFYRDYKEAAGREKSFEDDLDILNRIDDGRIAKAIEDGIFWVEEYYREPIWEWVTKHTTVKELAQKYSCSESTIRRKQQKYVYGVAFELGEHITWSNLRTQNRKVRRS